MSTPVEAGHGVTTAILNQLAAAGRALPLGDMVLLQAIMEENALDGTLTDGVDIDARNAVAWRVAAVGPDATGKVFVDDVVLSIALAGDALAKGSPWRMVRVGHLIGSFGPIIKAPSKQAKAA